jgi:hypothetical protein
LAKIKQDPTIPVGKGLQCIVMKAPSSGRPSKLLSILVELLPRFESVLVELLPRLETVLLRSFLTVFIVIELVKSVMQWVGR